MPQRPRVPRSLHWHWLEVWGNQELGLGDAANVVHGHTRQGLPQYEAGVVYTEYRFLRDDDLHAATAGQGQVCALLDFAVALSVCVLQRHYDARHSPAKIHRPADVW